MAVNAAWQQQARRYEAAGHVATGLTLKFVPVDAPAAPITFGRQENPFCALLHSRAGGCPFCPHIQKHLLVQVRQKQAPHVTHCPAGLVMLAVPVMGDGQHVATLLGGHVSDGTGRSPRLASLARQTGIAGAQLARAYRATPRMTRERLRATVRLLDYLAQSLGESVVHQVLGHQSGEAVAVAVARDYVSAHLTEPVHLADVARYVHLEPHYFCRLFHKQTGLTFGHYVAQRRVARVKQLLVSTSQRVSEIAFACGFGSIPQFNRVFRRHTGRSPTQYRRQARRGNI